MTNCPAIPTISLVAAYHDRRPQLIRTLRSIAVSHVKNIEFIAVDDGSSAAHRLEDLPALFGFPLRIIRLDPDRKWYWNPCVPFNVGIRAARVSIVVLQNPDCIHAGDVLAHVTTHLGLGDYLSYACYSLDKERTGRLDGIPLASADFHGAIADRVLPLPAVAAASDGALGWYNHSLLRPAGYHFLSATYKQNMDDLNGFDERYAHGIGYDDDEILARIRRKGMTVRIIDEPCVLHQWHYAARALDHRGSVNRAAPRNNLDLFLDTTMKETGYRANTEGRDSLDDNGRGP